MEQHIVQVISDPELQRDVTASVLGGAVTSVVGGGIKAALAAVQAKFSGAPEPTQRQVAANAEAFAELLASKMAEKAKLDPPSRDCIGEELSTPKGYSALQHAMDVAAEIDDQFTRESLAELVVRRLATHNASRLQIATRIATEAVAYLTEQQLRLLAFMTLVQFLRPLTASSESEDEWTRTVLSWLRRLGPLLVVSPDIRDLNLLTSTGLLNVVYAVKFNFKLNLKSGEGFVPAIDDFLTTDPLGMRLMSGCNVVQNCILNSAGKVLAATVVDKITGSTTALIDF